MRVGVLSLRPASASFAFIPARLTVKAGKVAEPASEDLNLVEEVECFEARQNVALESESKRDHRHDHRDADDDAHRRQDRAQLCLSQVS